MSKDGFLGVTVNDAVLNGTKVDERSSASTVTVTSRGVEAGRPRDGMVLDVEADGEISDGEISDGEISDALSAAESSTTLRFMRQVASATAGSSAERLRAVHAVASELVQCAASRRSTVLAQHATTAAALVEMHYYAAHGTVPYGTAGRRSRMRQQMPLGAVSTPTQRAPRREN